MIEKLILPFVKKTVLLYLFVFPGKFKFKFLNNLNFRIIDFNDYEKNKNIIFRNDFYKLEKNSIIRNFDFINLCNSLGGKRGIELAKLGIFKCYNINKFKTNTFWNTEHIANRVFNLVNNFDFINSISTKKDEDNLRKLLKINIAAFNKFLFYKNIFDYSFLEFKVYILIKCILGNKITNLKNDFEKITENQIDSFAMHKSYNIFEQAKCINNIDEIIIILLNFNYDVPEVLYVSKVRMETVLAQYFHKDSSLALFNGVSNNNTKKIKLALSGKKNIRKIKFPNSSNGLFFFEDKYKKIFLDAVQPTSSLHSKKLSAGTLSLEFSSEKEKIITNCGAVEKSTGNAAYLRYSAAHSTIVLENTNISEIRDNQPHIKYPQIVSFKSQLDNTKHTIEASHNGYLKNYKKIVKRKINFQEIENHLMGEDSIISSTSENKEVVFHIRFHIMPNINITQINNKRSIILKTERGNIWLFKANKDIVLEESVYVDKNNIKQTNQIVIKGITRNNREKINWSLSKK